MILRSAVAVALSLATGIFAFAAGMGLSGSKVVSVLVATLAAALVGLLVVKGRAVVLDAEGCPRWLGVVSGLATTAALLQVARLAVFMIDPSRVAFSFAPSSLWEQQHSCLSAYHVAAEASSTSNIYDNALYSMPDDDPDGPRKARMLGAFKIDVFEYPPPFLLLPGALHSLTPEFLDLRMVWFALSGGLLLFGLVTVAGFLGPVMGTRALLLGPFVWLAPTTMSTLQKGNVQVIIVVAALLAMVLFERRQPIAGGALLAFATASKIYPVLLVAYLLVRRQWRAVAWTAAWGVALCALSLATFGWDPYVAFLDHLPRLMSGEAFPAFRNPGAMAINLSIPGLLFKAKHFGASGITFDQAGLLGLAYMVVVLAVTVWAAWRSPRAEERALTWMAIVILATLRSPFLPVAYGTLPPLWLLTLLVAASDPRGRALAAAFGAWLVLSFNWPMDWPIDLRWLAVATVVQLLLIVIVVARALRRRGA